MTYFASPYRALAQEVISRVLEEHPVKDAEKKEHPCFVPYEQLPAEQRAKDYLFGAIVEALWNAGMIEV